MSDAPVAVRPTPGSGTPATRPVVFVSYSREDSGWRDRFGIMLSPLLGNRRIDYWADEYSIQVGDEWRREIDLAVHRSVLALVLVSADLLFSRFVMQEELPALTAHGVRLVCVLVQDCLWQEAEVLRRVQWAHDPGRDGPLARPGTTIREHDREISRICLEIDTLLPQGAEGDGEQATSPNGGAARVVQAPPRRVVSTIGPARVLGDLHEVPAMPPGYVERDEVAELRSALLRGDEGALGITGEVRAFGLHGQGGIGKSVLASALARDEEVRRHFPDGIYWVTVGESADLLGLQLDLLGRLGGSPPQVRLINEARDHLRKLLEDQQTLLIVDDVWSAAAAGAFLVAGPLGRVLFTTRDPATLDSVGARVAEVDVLPPATARGLLARLSGTDVERLPDAELERVFRATDRVALALALVGAAVGQGGRTWNEVADELERGGDTFLDHPYANTFKSMQVGLSALDDDLASAYRSLAVYPEDTTIPIDAVVRFWRHLWELSPEETRIRIESLAGRELLALGDESIAFHDLQREFLLLETRDAAVLHAELIAAYRALLPPGGDWWMLPTDEPYIWDHLVHHFRGARDYAAVASIVSDLAFLTMRMHTGGRHGAEADLRQAAALNPEHPGIAWVLRLLMQWGHLFADRGLGDLAATVASRSTEAPPEVDTGKLAALLPACHLAPRGPLPAAPPAVLRVLDLGGGAFDLAFSPDGRHLATAGAGAVDLWDVASGEGVALPVSQELLVNKIAFSATGETLVMAGLRTVRIWNMATRQEVGTIELDGPERRSLDALAIAPDGRIAAGADRDGRVQIYDLIGCKVLATAQVIGRRALKKSYGLADLKLAFSSDGRTLAIGDSSGRLQLLDVSRARVVGHLRKNRFLPWGKPHALRVSAVAFRQDGSLVSAGSDGEILVWDVARRRLVGRAVAEGGSALRAAFGADASVLVTVSSGEGVTVTRVATGQIVGSGTATGISHYAIAAGADGRLVASRGSDGKVRLWDVGNQKSLVGTDDTDHSMYFTGISPDGRFGLVMRRGGNRQVWDLAQDREVAAAPRDSMALSPGGEAVAVGRRFSRRFKRTVRVLDVRTGRSLGSFKGLPTDILMDVVFGADASTLATTDGTNTAVRIWREGASHAIGELAVPATRVQAMRFSRDGRRLAIASEGGLGLWDLETNQWDVLFAEASVSSNDNLKFSGDGRLLAVGGYARTVQLYELGGEMRTAAIDLGPGTYLSGAAVVEFSPDSRLLAVAVDEALQVFSIDDGKRQAGLRLGFGVRHLVWGEWGMSAVTDAGLVGLDLVGAEAPAHR